MYSSSFLGSPPVNISIFKVPSVTLAVCNAMCWEREHGQNLEIFRCGDFRVIPVPVTGARNMGDCDDGEVGNGKLLGDRGDRGL